MLVVGPHLRGDDGGWGCWCGYQPFDGEYYGAAAKPGRGGRVELRMPMALKRVPMP